MIFKRRTWLVLECNEETSSIAERELSKGDRIAILLGEDLIVDGEEDHGGEWGWGRYTEAEILGFSAQVEDLRDFEIFWQAKAEKLELASADLL